jgi:hypothetical protein
LSITASETRGIVDQQAKTPTPKGVELFPDFPHCRQRFWPARPRPPTRRSLFPFRFEVCFTLGVICNYTAISFRICISISNEFNTSRGCITHYPFNSLSCALGYGKVRPLRGHGSPRACDNSKRPRQGSNLSITAGETREIVNQQAKTPTPKGVELFPDPPPLPTTLSASAAKAPD